MNKPIVGIVSLSAGDSQQSSIVRARTSDYNRRVEGYFCDNQKIVEINKYIVCHGDAVARLKYGLDEWDFLDIQLCYIESILECPKELHLISDWLDLVKLPEEGEEVDENVQKYYESVLKKIQERYGFSESELDTVLSKITEMRDSWKTIADTEARTALLLDPNNRRAPGYAKWLERSREAKISKNSAIERITGIWKTREDFESATAEEIKRRCPDINIFARGIYGYSWQPSSGGRIRRLDILDNKMAQLRFAAFIYDSDKPSEVVLGIPILQKSVGTVTETHTGGHHIFDVHLTPNSVINTLNDFVKNYAKLVEDRRSPDRIAQLFGLLNDVWTFVRNHKNQFVFSQLEVIYTTFFRYHKWMTNDEQNKWLADCREQLYTIMEKQAKTAGDYSFMMTIPDILPEKHRAYLAKLRELKK